MALTGSSGLSILHDAATAVGFSEYRFTVRVSALSAVDYGVVDHNGNNGQRGIGVRFRRGSLKDGYHDQGWQQARKLPNTDVHGEAATRHGTFCWSLRSELVEWMRTQTMQ